MSLGVFVLVPEEEEDDVLVDGVVTLFFTTLLRFARSGNLYLWVSKMERFAFNTVKPCGEEYTAVNGNVVRVKAFAAVLLLLLFTELL